MRITWTERSMEDREAIFERVSADSYSAAVRLDDELKSQVRRLIDYPQSGRIGRMPGILEFVYSGLPYIAAYRVVEESVDILRLFHAAQLWPERLTDFE